MTLARLAPWPLLDALVALLLLLLFVLLVVALVVFVDEDAEALLLASVGVFVVEADVA